MTARPRKAAKGVLTPCIANVRKVSGARFVMICTDCLFLLLIILNVRSDCAVLFLFSLNCDIVIYHSSIYSYFGA